MNAPRPGINSRVSDGAEMLCNTPSSGASAFLLLNVFLPKAETGWGGGGGYFLGCGGQMGTPVFSTA